MSLPTLHIPDKIFYTIGDVCRMTGTKPHVLRYWEAQFKLLQPARRYSGHRKYTQREIDLINRIKYLILERKFTLSGAKREMTRQQSATAKVTSDSPPLQKTSQILLREIKKEIDDCLLILTSDEPVQQDLIKI